MDQELADRLFAENVSSVRDASELMVSDAVLLQRHEEKEEKRRQAEEKSRLIEAQRQAKEEKQRREEEESRRIEAELSRRKREAECEAASRRREYVEEFERVERDRVAQVCREYRERQALTLFNAGWGKMIGIKNFQRYLETIPVLSASQRMIASSPFRFDTIICFSEPDSFGLTIAKVRDSRTKEVIWSGPRSFSFSTDDDRIARRYPCVLLVDPRVGVIKACRLLGLHHDCDGGCARMEKSGRKVIKPYWIACGFSNPSSGTCAPCEGRKTLKRGEEPLNAHEGAAFFAQRNFDAAFSDAAGYGIDLAAKIPGRHWSRISCLQQNSEKHNAWELACGVSGKTINWHIKFGVKMRQTSE